MFELPAALPADYPAPPALVRACAKEAAAHYDLPFLTLLAIAQAEGGNIGTVSANSNASYDLGIMQINTVHLPAIKAHFGLDWHALAYEPCINIAVGAWILSQRMQEAPDLWEAVGNYHSRTLAPHYAYRAKVSKIYKALALEALGPVALSISAGQ